MALPTFDVGPVVCGGAGPARGVAVARSAWMLRAAWIT